MLRAYVCAFTIKVSHALSSVECLISTTLTLGDAKQATCPGVDALPFPILDDAEMPVICGRPFQAGTDGQCSPRQVIPYDSIHEGPQCEG